MKTLERIDRILEYLSAAPGDGEPLRKVAQAAGLAPSSTHRMLQALLASGYVVQEEATGHYRLGIRVFQFASRYLAHVGIVGLMDGYLKELCAVTGRHVTAYVREAASVVCVAIQTPTPNRFFVNLGGLLPLHASAGAKALIHHLDHADLRMMLATAVESSFTDKTLRTVDDVLDDLKAGEARGYWECIEELEDGVCAISSPIKNLEGKPVVSVTVTCLTPQFRSHHEELVTDLLRVTREATDALGPVLALVQHP